jgi:hypothetical protein
MTDDISYVPFLRDDKMHERGYSVMTISKPSEDVAMAIEDAAKGIEDAIGRQIDESKFGEEPTRHFQGDFQSLLDWAANAFMTLNVNVCLDLSPFIPVTYHVQIVYIWEAFLGIRDKAKGERAGVVRRVRPEESDNEPKAYRVGPYMVGPRGHGVAEAILLIRPFRKRLSPEGGFFWAYKGSHGLSALEFERRLNEDSLELEPLTVELNQILILFSTLWIAFPIEFKENDGDIFVYKGYKHGITEPANIIKNNVPGYVPDDDVVPFMRSLG